MTRLPHAPRPRVALGALAVTLSLACLAGCGHPATEGECREILRRAARLELEARLENDKALIDQELAGIEDSMKGAMMNRCVGKRITESVMVCVREAKTADELFEECFQ